MSDYTKITIDNDIYFRNVATNELLMELGSLNRRIPLMEKQFLEMSIPIMYNDIVRQVVSFNKIKEETLRLIEKCIGLFELMNQVNANQL